MLTPEQVEALRDKFELIAEPVNRFLIEDIVRRICEAGKVTSTARYEAVIARMLNVNEQDVKSYLAQETTREIGKFKKVFEQVAQLTYEQTTTALGISTLAYEHNEALQNLVQAAVELAAEDFTNLTQTLGMIDPYGNPLPLHDVYISCTDYAFKKVMTGAQDYRTAVKEATANISKYGVRVIEYESGVNTSLDAAIRRDIFGGMGLLVEKIEQKTHDEIGCNGWEISAHEACAVDHEPYQGRQYTDAEFLEINGTADQPGLLARRIGTLNCKHVAFPIIFGVSEPQYSEEELQAMKDRNEKGITYDGKHYTEYEATQKQREIERNIRKQRRKIVVYEQDPEAFKEELETARVRYSVLRDKYVKFSNAAGLQTQPERIETLGFGPKQEKNTI